MARILVDADHGPSIREPAVGSGGMLRSVAQTLREQNLNPHDYAWYGNDIDHFATACAAVNAITWDLGPKTVIWRGDSLATEDAGLAQALTERTAIIRHRNAVVEQAQFEHKARHMLRALDRLAEGAAA